MWMPCSLLSPLRILFYRYGGEALNEVIPLLDYCVPAAGLLFWLAYLSRKNRFGDLKEEIPLLLTMTMLFVPYCHIFDHSLLLLLHVVIIYTIFSVPKSRSWGLLVFGYSCFAAVNFVIQFYLKVDDYRLFWQPIPLYFLYLYATKVCNKVI